MAGREANERKRGGVHTLENTGKRGKIPWRGEWQPIPVFLPGEFHGQRNLSGYSPQGTKESHMTEGLSIHTYHQPLGFIVLYILIFGSGKLCNYNCN